MTKEKERYYRIKLSENDVSYFDSKNQPVLNVFDPKVNVIKVEMIPISDLGEIIGVKELFYQHNSNKRI